MIRESDRREIVDWQAEAQANLPDWAIEHAWGTPLSASSGPQPAPQAKQEDFAGLHQEHSAGVIHGQVTEIGAKRFAQAVLAARAAATATESTGCVSTGGSAKRDRQSRSGRRTEKRKRATMDKAAPDSQDSASESTWEHLWEAAGLESNKLQTLQDSAAYQRLVAHIDKMGVMGFSQASTQEAKMISAKRKASASPDGTSYCKRAAARRGRRGTETTTEAATSVGSRGRQRHEAGRSSGRPSRTSSPTESELNKRLWADTSDARLGTSRGPSGRRRPRGISLERERWRAQQEECIRRAEAEHGTGPVVGVPQPPLTPEEEKKATALVKKMMDLSTSEGGLRNRGSFSGDYNRARAAVRRKEREEEAQRLAEAGEQTPGQLQRRKKGAKRESAGRQSSKRLKEKEEETQRLEVAGVKTPRQLPNRPKGAAKSAVRRPPTWGKGRPARQPASATGKEEEAAKVQAEEEGTVPEEVAGKVWFEKLKRQVQRCWSGGRTPASSRFVHHIATRNLLQ
eukprot:GHVU01203534.1.p1 GENE.GHVU01203534.1~~GHVU01203534.1.p1  ORF type:complete len:513 (+),score=73.45 GHVU01203534.1:1272-2810(+)